MKNMLISLFLVTTFSCDIQLDPEGEEEVVSGEATLNEYVIGSAPKDERILSAREMNVGEDMCNSFEIMRDAVYPSVDVLYNQQEVSCFNVVGPVIRKNAKLVNTLGENPRLEGDIFFKDVLSDIHPFIKPFCSKIMDGELRTDTHRMSANKVIKVHFKEINRQSYVQIFEFLNNRLNRIHTAKVALGSSVQGMTVFRSVARPCASAGRVHTFIQELVL